MLLKVTVLMYFSWKFFILNSLFENTWKKFLIFLSEHVRLLIKLLFGGATSASAIRARDPQQRTWVQRVSAHNCVWGVENSKVVMGVNGCLRQWYHIGCLFDTFNTATPSTRIISNLSEDVEGWESVYLARHELHTELRKYRTAGEKKNFFYDIHFSFFFFSLICFKFN